MAPAFDIGLLKRLPLCDFTMYLLPPTFCSTIERCLFSKLAHLFALAR